MKNLSFVFILLFVVQFLFSDTIYFKDGNVLSGDVLKTTDTEIVVYTPMGVMTLQRDSIDRVVKSSPEKMSDNAVSSNINIVAKDIYRFDPEFQESRKSFGLALAFLIPGSALFFGNLAIGTGFIISYYSQDQYEWRYSEIYDEETQRTEYIDYSVKVGHNMLGAGIYASIMITGLVVSAISIPFFIKSNHHVNNFKKRHNMVMEGSFEGDRLSMALRFSL